MTATSGQTLSVAEARTLAEAAGFRGVAAQTIVAIAQAESGLRPLATNTAGNTPPSTDRGILQINSFWHPEVSNACAFDAACSFTQGYRISAGGTTFNQWAAYKQGTYKQYLTTMGPNDAYTPGGGTMDTIAAAAAAVTAAKDALDVTATIAALKAWLTKPERIAKLLVGVVLIAVGILGVAGGGALPNLPALPGGA